MKGQKAMTNTKTITKQTILTEVKKVAAGMKAGKKWSLYKYTDTEGMEFTSLKDDYPLEEPIEIEFTEKEVQGRYKVFINRQLVEPKEGMRATKREYDTGEDMLERLKSIEAKVDSLLRGLKTIADKML